MHRKTLRNTLRNTPMATAALTLLTAGLVACGGGDDDNGPAPILSVSVGDTVVLTTANQIASFNRAAPATTVGSIAISGLATGETLVGIDVRPADGKLYALGSAGNVYTVEPATGVATLKVALRAVSGDDNPYTALSGDSFGIDFNPVADRLRVVSNTGQNLRINVDTGDALTDGAIALPAGTASVTAAGYTNAFAGTTTTQLFDLDVTSGLLHLQDPPNNGTLAVGLPLGVTATAANGFDIDARNNTGYAALTVGGATSLYTINLSTGAATVVAGGAIAGGQSVRGLALLQTAKPTAIGLTASNQLVSFDPTAPGTVTATTAITGLGVGETVVGIDVRPQDGLLYALARTTTSGGKLYTVDVATGAATFRADLIANPADTTDGNAPYSVLVGNSFSVDFNPAANRLRVVSDTGQSLRIAVETVTGTGAITAGATITDLDINRAVPASVVAAAYTNNFAGTTTTALYDIETNSNTLSLQNPPNAGTLVDVGALGLDVAGAAAFDIAGGANGLALAALRTATIGPSTLYSVNLSTGAATLYRGLSASAAQIGGPAGVALIDLAIRF